MNAFDLVFCILLAALVVYGLLRGLVQVVLSIAALVGAFVAANAWHEPLAQHFEASGGALPVRRIAAWVAIFVGVILLGAVVSWLAARLVRVRRTGRHAYYALDDHHVIGLLHDTRKHVEEEPS